VPHTFGIITSGLLLPDVVLIGRLHINLLIGVKIL
jgi:hypothetical protein